MFIKNLTLLAINFSLIYCTAIDSSYIANDTLFNNPTIKEINKIYLSTLGRDNDPKLISDISKTKLLFRKIGWSFMTIPGLRFWTKLLYPKSTISHFNVNDAVALTIDDGFCGIDNPKGCMVNEVRELLNEYNAHATFFVTGTHCKNVSTIDINKLIKDGNEISNHNMMDWKYDKYTAKDFEFDLLLSKDILNIYNQNYSNWYRAPFGSLSKNMEKIINKHNLTHVIPDAFAHDTYIPDPEWISKHILRKVKPGSIILIHMPERDVREWNYDAIKLTLEGLKEKKLRVLNLSEIKSVQGQ